MIRYHIPPLEKEDVRDYILHRLNVAGGTDRVEFTHEAIHLIANFSSGVPRLINAICDRALLAGFAMETNKIDAQIINRCLQELSSYFSPREI